MMPDELDNNISISYNNSRTGETKINVKINPSFSQEVGSS